MQTILTILFILVGIVGGYVSYIRCKTGKIKYPITISIFIFIITLFVISFLTKTQLADYMKNVFLSDNLGLFSMGSFLFFTALYISFILITEDLLKNLSVFIALFTWTKK